MPSQTGDVECIIVPETKCLVQTRISPGADEALKAKALSHGVSMAAYVRQVIYKDLGMFATAKRARSTDRREVTSTGKRKR